MKSEAQKVIRGFEILIVGIIIGLMCSKLIFFEQEDCNVVSDLPDCICNQIECEETNCQKEIIEDLIENKDFKEELKIVLKET